MRKILLSLASIAATGALAFVATSAFFSDTETSVGNLFQAGGVDLLVDSQSHYAGMVCNSEGVWESEGTASTDPQDPDTSTRPELLGTVCSGTWEQTDLNTLASSAFFNFSDLKPGDQGENTISLHLDGNDSYMCAIIDNMQDDDLGLTEPEQEDGDETDGAGNGELASELHFFAWADDGDNIWEGGEPELFSNTEGPASDVLGGVVYPMFTPGSGALASNSTYYVGMYWCYGDITVGANTLSCSGESVTNLSQTDQLTADISFYVEQARNNEDFQCPSLEPEFLIGAALSEYTQPSNCDITVGPEQSETATTSQTINGGIAQASPGNLICVEEGTYNEDVDIDKSVSLLGDGASATSTINGQNTGYRGAINVEADNVTISGFDIIGVGHAAIYAPVPVTGLNVKYNKLTTPSGGVGFVNAYGNALTNTAFEHNVFVGNSAIQLAYINGGSADSVNFEYNDFTGSISSGGVVLGSEAINSSILRNSFSVSGSTYGIVETFASNTTDINENNFLSATTIKVINGDGAGTLNAEDNWWGDTDPSDNVSGSVDHDPNASSAFDEN